MTRFGSCPALAAPWGVAIRPRAMPIKLIWNASASAPIGFTIAFRDRSPLPIWSPSMHRNRSPPSWPNAAASRRAAAERILAVSGQTVCRAGLAITVDGVMGVALTAIALGRDLPGLAGLPPSRPAKSSS